MPMNDINDTLYVLKKKADKIVNVTPAVSAPTQAEYNGLVSAFNSLLAELRNLKTTI